MLRFRNRFRGTPSTPLTCECGRHVTVSGEPGKQTVIHEYPWCASFTAAIQQLQATDPSTVLHQAVMAVETSNAAAETTIVADVSDPVSPFSRGGVS